MFIFISFRYSASITKSEFDIIKDIGKMVVVSYNLTKGSRVRALVIKLCFVIELYRQYDPSRLV